MRLPCRATKRSCGKALLPLACDAFTKKPFRAAYQPGKLVFIYVAGCGEDHSMPTVATGLLGLARRLRMPIHKVSVTAQVHLRDRFRELSRFSWLHLSVVALEAVTPAAVAYTVNGIFGTVICVFTMLP